MSALSTTTKAKLGIKTGKTAAKHPRLLVVGGKAGGKAAKPAAWLGLRVGGPLARRRARRRVQSVAGTAHSVAEIARAVGETILVRGPQAARTLGLVEVPEPKEKRTAPRVVAGALIGAAVVYLLEPEHRRRVLHLVG